MSDLLSERIQKTVNTTAEVRACSMRTSANRGLRSCVDRLSLSHFSANLV